MERRHLFDYGFPVCVATLLAGSDVLLAVAHRSLVRSNHRLASAFVRLADSGERIRGSLGRCGCAHAEPRHLRENSGAIEHGNREHPGG